MLFSHLIPESLDVSDLSGNLASLRLLLLRDLSLTSSLGSASVAVLRALVGRLRRSLLDIQTTHQDAGGLTLYRTTHHDTGGLTLVRFNGNVNTYKVMWCQGCV